MEHCKLLSIKLFLFKKRINVFLLRVNKFVGTFFSTGSLGAGQESTALTTLPFFAHMGMIYVPIGGKHKSLGDISIAHGGSAWGYAILYYCLRIFLSK